MGLFKVNNDHFAAVYRDEETGQEVLFPGQNGMAYRDEPQLGSMNQLGDDAEIRASNDSTLIEAASAFLSGRLPRWKT